MAKQKKTSTPPEEANQLLERILTDATLQDKTLRKAEAVEIAILAYRLFRKYYYSDAMPFPQNILAYLYELKAEGDKRAQRHIDYLESWGEETAIREALDDSAIVVGDCWIL